MQKSSVQNESIILSNTSLKELLNNQILAYKNIVAKLFDDISIKAE